MPAVSLTNRLPLPASPARRRSANRQASPSPGTHRYQRHRPEQSLLYQIVAQHYPVFVDQLAAQGTTLPKYVAREFDEYLKCV